jgi:hypothetical protein
MEINRQVLRDAVQQGVLSEAQADQLWSFLGSRAAATPGFHITHTLYYLGGLLAIGAMTLFMTLGWETFGGWGLVGIALVYAVIGLWLTERFLHRMHLPIPAGITATFVVVLTPLAVYGLQSALGWWAEGRVYREYHTYIDWRWVFMEFATLGVGAVMLWRYRLPFLVMPVAVTLWYMSMDFVPFLAGEFDPDWQLRKMVSLWFGALMLALAFWVDVRTRHGRDFAFWLYLFGALTFWCGLTLLYPEGELGRFGYLCLNLAFIAVGAVLGRRIFAVLGGLGAAGYVGHLAYDVFEDSVLFPFVLTALGLGVVLLGIQWQRHEESITRRLRGFLPGPIRELVENRA